MTGQLNERKKKFKDYFQDKIDKEPSWADDFRKLKKKTAEFGSEPEEESGDQDPKATEKLSDSADYPL
tara:strand:- start:1665 stop:1868 length:204 start_codon:yes stop_codon:yes gene_type:complete